MADVTARPRRAPKQRILLNVSPELAERLRDLASRERRPLSTQIEMLVERALAADEIEGAGSGLVPA